MFAPEMPLSPRKPKKRRATPAVRVQYGALPYRFTQMGALGSIVTFIGTTTIIPFLPDAWAQEAGGFPIMTLPLGFLMKDVLFLAASFYLLKQGLVRAALDIERS